MNVFPGSLLAPLTVDEDIQALIDKLQPEPAVALSAQAGGPDLIYGTATFAGFVGLAG